MSDLIDTGGDLPAVTDKPFMPFDEIDVAYAMLETALQGFVDHTVGFTPDTELELNALMETVPDESKEAVYIIFLSFITHCGLVPPPTVLENETVN